MNKWTRVGVWICGVGLANCGFGLIEPSLKHLAAIILLLAGNYLFIIVAWKE